jgi:hypothetical protein
MAQLIEVVDIRFEQVTALCFFWSVVPYLSRSDPEGGGSTFLDVYQITPHHIPQDRTIISTPRETKISQAVSKSIAVATKTLQFQTHFC